jgi:hypothetical protein
MAFLRVRTVVQRSWCDGIRTCSTNSSTVSSSAALTIGGAKGGEVRGSWAVSLPLIRRRGVGPILCPENKRRERRR